MISFLVKASRRRQGQTNRHCSSDTLCGRTRTQQKSGVNHDMDIPCFPFVQEQAVGVENLTSGAMADIKISDAQKAAAVLEKQATPQKYQKIPLVKLQLSVSAKVASW
jgi:hypothetical protein